MTADQPVNLKIMALKTTDMGLKLEVQVVQVWYWKVVLRFYASALYLLCL